MNNKRKIGEMYRPKAIDSFGYQPSEQVSMPPKPPTSGSNIIKTEEEAKRKMEELTNEQIYNPFIFN